MSILSTSLLAPYFLSALICAWVGYLAWNRRSVPGARLLAGVAWSETIWALGFLFQLAATSLSTKLFWNNVQFIGAVGAPLAYLGFALEYDHPSPNSRRLTWKLLLPLAVVMLLYIWSDGWHHQFRGIPYLAAGTPFNVLIFGDSYGFGFYTIYAYTLISLTTLLLIVRYLTATRLYRLQVGILMLGILFPWVTSVITALELVPVKLHEITPITFGISNLIIAWALFRYLLLDILPVARDYLIENMHEGVIVLDSAFRIVDLNPAAQAIFNMPARIAVGQKADTCLPIEPGFFEDICQEGTHTTEISLVRDNLESPYEVQLSNMQHPRVPSTIFLVQIRDITQRRAYEETLRQMAITDPLTGINNRRQIFNLAQQEIKRAHRLGRNLALILFDVDHFKSINDSFGHLVGDQVLVMLTGLCMQNLRSIDRIGRFGGEEFLILLPETTLEEAVLTAERLRKLVERMIVSKENGEARITISLGVASLDKRSWIDLDRLLEETDQALFRAKIAGRNRTETLEQLPVNEELMADRSTPAV
jgi:diguanylate cyclase (GGDEF)-like protein/PAS domain S-box-containing protein